MYSFIHNVWYIWYYIHVACIVCLHSFHGVFLMWNTCAIWIDEIFRLQTIIHATWLVNYNPNVFVRDKAMRKIQIDRFVLIHFHVFYIANVENYSMCHSPERKQIIEIEKNIAK